MRTIITWNQKRRPFCTLGVDTYQSGVSIKTILKMLNLLLTPIKHKQPHFQTKHTIPHEIEHSRTGR